MVKRGPHVQAEDSGFVYYTQYFTGPSQPARLGPPLVPIGTISLLTLDGDNNTWSVTIFSATRDAPLKALRHADCFTRVVRACPLQAHWLDGEPITGVLAMAGILDRYRRFVVDGTPVVTGYAAVGDAWACTNPSAGRGISVGIVHAQLLRRTVQDHLGDPAGFAQAWDEGTEQLVAPFYWNQIAADRGPPGGDDGAAGGPFARSPGSALDRPVLEGYTIGSGRGFVSAIGGGAGWFGDQEGSGELDAGRPGNRDCGGRPCRTRACSPAPPRRYPVRGVRAEVAG